MSETIWKRSKKNINAYCPICKSRTMVPVEKIPTITEKLNYSKETKKTIFKCTKCGLRNTI